MRRADTQRCSSASVGDHSWVEVTKNEEANQGLQRFTCAACGIQTMEKDPNANQAPWKL